MARKNSKTPVVIADSIVIDAPIDHFSQASSWTATETTDELPQVFTDFVAANPEGTVGEFARELTGADLTMLEEFGPVITEPSAEIEQLLEQIEESATAYESQPAETAPEPDAVLEPSASEPPVQDTPAGPSFAEMIAAYDDEVVTEKAHAISDSVEDRVQYELKHGHPNIQSTLKKVRSAFVSMAAARVMIATATSEDFINRSVHEGKRYNVYALGKAADIMKAVTDGAMSNAINLACMRSLFAMRAAGLPFTLETAKACASKNYACDAAIRKHLVRHTVSPSTAPTQASSTMQALTTLGVVRTTGSSKNPTFTLTDHPIVAKLEEVVLRAA